MHFGYVSPTDLPDGSDEKQDFYDKQREAATQLFGTAPPGPINRIGASVEHGILTGRVARIEKDDRRGRRYVLEGFAVDQQTSIGIVGRFTANGRYLIITVYKTSDSQE